MRQLELCDGKEKREKLYKLLSMYSRMKLSILVIELCMINEFRVSFKSLGEFGSRTIGEICCQSNNNIARIWFKNDRQNMLSK